MSNILALDTAVAEPERHSQRHLRRLSRVLSWLFTALLALCALYLVAGIVVVLFFSAHVQMNAQGVTLLFGPHGEIPPAVRGMVRFSDQPVITRLAGIADFAIAQAPFFFIFWHLRGLFGLYATGTVFARRNATHLKHVGFWLIAYPIAKFASNMVFRLAGGLDHAWFHPIIYQAPIAGIIVVAIALVMEFGHEIEKEKDSFI
jgi:hypothetical protein